MSQTHHPICQQLTLKMSVCAVILFVFFVAISKLIQPVNDEDVDIAEVSPASALAPDAIEDPHSAMLYALLLAEIAWQNGHWDIAAQQYLSAAQTSQDAHIARLATSAALQYEELNLALEAASLWARLAPTEAEAQAITVTLLFKAGNEQASLPFLNNLLQLTEKEQTTFFSLIFLSLEEKEQMAFLETLSTLDPDLQIEEAKLAWSK